MFDQNGHRFLHLGRDRIVSDADNQMYVKDKYGGRWNVVRLLLERAGRLAEGKGWVNTCGFSECVLTSHWAPSRPFSSGLHVLIYEHDIELRVHGKRLTRDHAFPALISPDRSDAHLARFLYGKDGSRVVTACGININPVTLVPCVRVLCSSCLK